jgi:capsular polysaccharide biosynthesis protein
MWNSANICLRATSAPQKQITIPEGILLNGQACNNWYHWLINVLPKAFIAEKHLELSPKIPYLVSRSVQGTRMEEALRLVIGDDRKVLFLEDGPHKVQRGIVIEAPSREVYRPKNILWPINWAELGSFHSEIMAQYRSHILEKVKLGRLDTAPPTPGRIFLARDNFSRPYNENEVWTLLEGMGFNPVRLERLPFTEQVALMAEATMVVGPTGAQWAGWLFSERAVGLILVPRFLTRSSLFAKLGAAGSSELLELSMNSDAISWGQYFSTRVATRVDISRLKQVVHVIAERASPS